MRWLIGSVFMVVVVALVAEEATQGYVLGLSPLAPLCDALGGKHALNAGRCYTRLCYWFGGCGYWASPVVWANRLKPVDSESKVVFWLGEPDQRLGDEFSWHCWKADIGTLKAKIRDGRLVDLVGCGREIER